ncbi:MAG: sigma-70 family RNA polymerase sigma factor [Nitrospira sp.]|nr:sigma-70 family RNA polymerase sigma factor [Nitrospira sp.]
MQPEHTIPCLSAFEQHHNDLLRFFTHKLGCRDLAADCAQETYVHLVRMRPNIDVQNPRAFLFRVAANLAVDNLRKIRIRREAMSIDPLPENAASLAPSAEDALDAKQRLVRLERAMGELSPKCRSALLMNRLDGKTHREIAEELGVSESMVAKYVIQALKHCRARLRSEEVTSRS